MRKKKCEHNSKRDTNDDDKLKYKQRNKIRAIIRLNAIRWQNGNSGQYTTQCVKKKSVMFNFHFDKTENNYLSE